MNGTALMITHVLSLSCIPISGEIFIPYFTGRVVDGIVIDKSREEFTSAIIYMALISAGR